MFADVHSHVLCGIDDGARSINDSQRSLQLLRQNGITHLAFTPHYYPHRNSVQTFLRRRARAYQAVKELPEAKTMTLTVGAEVYLGETLFNNEDLMPLCYEGTRYMLTELEYNSYFTDASDYRLLRLIEDYGVIPVLAHIDRFPFLWNDLHLLEKLKKMGCCFQMNISALQGFFSRRRAIKLFEFGFLDFLGEDVHRSVLPFKEKERMRIRTEKRNPGFFEELSSNAAARLFVAR